MLKIDNFEVLGWEHAIRGMRNPMNSWEKSDSCFKRCIDGDPTGLFELSPSKCPKIMSCKIADDHDHHIGPNDHDLMMRLRKAGTDHRKFMRMITVYLDITAPLYWWKEFDTYKVGTVANSCSTMHKIAAKGFTLEDFSCEHLLGYGDIYKDIPDCLDISNACCIWNEEGFGVDCPVNILNFTIEMLNKARTLYIKTNDKRYWWQMIQLLPSSYNQKRTIMLNYEVLANIYKSRKDHKLDEWHTFCHWIEELPYSEIILRHYSDEEK